MRRVLGVILSSLAGFFIFAAVLAWIYVPGKFEVTPVNVNAVTHLTGTATVLPTGEGSKLKATSHTVSDGAASDASVVVFDSFTCLVKDVGNPPDCVDDKDAQKRLVSAATDRFATDRTTALAVNEAKYVGDGATPHEGLVNKFPFRVEQKTYPFWDGVLGRAVDAVYTGTETLNGLPTYTFQISVANERAEIASGVTGTYSDDKTLWIDPVTGAIMNQSEHQVRSLNGTPVLDMKLAFTDEQVASNVASAKDNGSQISLLHKLPWVALVLGLLAAVGSFLLQRRGKDAQSGPSPRDAGVDEVLAGAGPRRRDQRH